MALELKREKILPVVTNALTVPAEVWDGDRGAGDPCIPHCGHVQRWAQKGASVMLLPSSPAPSSRLSPTLLQLQLPLPMGAGLCDGFFFLLLKLFEQVPVWPSPLPGPCQKVWWQKGLKADW